MARAWAARCHLDDEVDAGASRALQRLGCVEPDWPDWVTWRLILWRTRWFRQWAREFFAQHPTALGMNLGAGLSDYFQWLNTSTNQWIDADHTRVMQLRQRCLHPHPGARDVVLDIRRSDWWQRVQTPHSDASTAPQWIMLEGVLMYWTAAQVRRFLHRLAQQAPEGTCLAFDVIPDWLVGWPIRVPSLSGRSAVFRWGIHDVYELASLHPRLQVERVISSPSPWALAVWPVGAGHAGWGPLTAYALIQMRVR
jgi:O-methyltransferase involved in polyketide biosynthesis